MRRTVIGSSRFFAATWILKIFWRFGVHVRSRVNSGGATSLPSPSVFDACHLVVTLDLPDVAGATGHVGSMKKIGGPGQIDLQQADAHQHDGGSARGINCWPNIRSSWANVQFLADGDGVGSVREQVVHRPPALLYVPVIEAERHVLA